MPLSCQQCEEAPCKKACLINAIDKDETTGAMLINENVCIRCRMCLLFCPFGAIGQDPDTLIMIKCDLCGGDPKCVQWCPNDAITYEEAQITAERKQRHFVNKYISDRASEARTISDAERDE